MVRFTCRAENLQTTILGKLLETDDFAIGIQAFSDPGSSERKPLDRLANFERKPRENGICSNVDVWQRRDETPSNHSPFREGLSVLREQMRSNSVQAETTQNLFVEQEIAEKLLAEQEIFIYRNLICLKTDHTENATVFCSPLFFGK